MEGEEELLKDARRLLAVNAGEQKRLEKLQRHIDKKRKEKERMLTRAQEDAMIKWYESSGKELNEFLYIKKSYIDEGKQHTSKVVTSSDIGQGHEIISNENIKQKRKRKQHKLSLQEKSCQGFLPGLDIAVFGFKAHSFQRERSKSLSSLTDTVIKENDKKAKSKVLESKIKDEHDKKNAFSDTHIVEITKEKPKKPLSAILPPLVLPPLHRHRRPSLQEYSNNACRVGENFSLNNTKSLKEHYDDLSECRYLRLYHPKKGI